MTEISASMVRDLREKTGAGMMECKKALSEAKGDMDAAVKILRESGITKAAKREGRTAGEGLAAVAISDDLTAGAIVELNCETDFVARNEGFVAIVKSLANQALRGKAANAEALLAMGLPEFDGRKAEAVIAEDLVAKIGEKIALSHAAYLTGDVVAGYVHPPGKIGVLVAAKLEGVSDKKAVSDALRNVAMHIAAASPRFLHEGGVDAKVLETEKEIAANIARKEGKPEQIIPKIVEGKVKAFYKENCLVHQPFVMDPAQTVTQVLDAAGKANGGKVTLSGFERFKVGESAAQ